MSFYCTKARILLISSFIWTLFINSGSTVNAKNWNTFWNGIKREKTDPLKVNAMRHLPLIPSQFTWELSNLFAGHAATTKGGVPVYVLGKDKLAFRFLELKETGTKVVIKNVKRSGKEHFYGVSVAGSEDGALFWVAGGNLLKKAAR